MDDQKQDNPVDAYADREYQIPANWQEPAQMTDPAPAPQGQKQPPNNMATASLVMGFLALTGCCCYYTGFIFGGLGILFALLSRTDKGFQGYAKIGLGISVAAIVLSVFMLGGILAVGLYNTGRLDMGPIKNLPVEPPKVTLPELNNVVTIFRNAAGTIGGGL